MEALAAASAELSTFLDDPSKFPDPYPMFRRLRDLEPVHWSEKYNFWVITGWPEAEQVMLSSAFSRELAAIKQWRPLGRPGLDDDAIVEAIDLHLAAFIQRDPPDHTRLRRLISRAFTPRGLQSWRPRIEAMCEGIIDDALRLEEFDFLTEIGYRLPEGVIWELVGAPIEELALWRDGADAISHAAVLTRPGGDVDGPQGDPRRIAQESLYRQMNFFRDLLARRDGLRGGADILSALIEAEEDGERLTEDELVATLCVLVRAGHNTTANLITNGMLTLLRHPDQFRLLQDDPTLIPNAVEEVFRFESPSRSQPREARQDVQVGDKVIRAGDQVQVILNAANRDPRRIDDPDRFDVARAKPDHLTFSVGVHYCLGANLARMEAQVLFEQACRRLGHLELAVEDVQWRRSVIKGVAALPVRQRHPVGVE